MNKPALYIIAAIIAGILGFIVFIGILSWIFRIALIVFVILFVYTYLRGRGRAIS